MPPKNIKKSSRSVTPVKVDKHEEESKKAPAKGRSGSKKHAEETKSPRPKSPKVGKGKQIPTNFEFSQQICSCQGLRPRAKARRYSVYLLQYGERCQG